jgi:two-component system response regulator HydG
VRGSVRQPKGNGHGQAILVVDRAGGFHAFVEEVLSPRGYAVHLGQDVRDALATLEREAIDVVLVDVCTPDGGLLEETERVIRESRDAAVLVVTGCPLMSSAARVLYPGGDGFLEKPCTPDELSRQVHDAASSRELSEDRGSSPFYGIVGVSPEIREVMEQVHTVGPTESTVLITGETGTGKELVARAIHQCSSRRNRPYVVVDTLALSESLLESELFGHERGAFTGAVESRKGLFRAAEGGTIFLDEMGEVPPAVQARLLRAIQEREVRPVGSTKPRSVDVRVIAATQRSPEDLLAEGRLRSDLFYRLSVFNIEIPPLRERPADVSPLVAYFLGSHPSASGGTPEATDLAYRILESHDWPGNVRELLATLESSLIRADGPRLTALDLPSKIRSAWRRRALSEDDDTHAALAAQALEEADGHRGRAAELLGVSRTTLWRWLNQEPG